MQNRQFQGLVFIFLGLLLVIFFSSVSVLRLLLVFVGLWLINYGLTVLGGPDIFYYIRLLIDMIERKMKGY